MHAALQPAMYVGLGAVAFWVYVRFPGRRPGTLVRALVHVAAAFLTVLLLPLLLALSFGVIGGRGAVLAFLFAAMMPSLCYLLLSWFWLLGRVVGDLGGGTPRGGHPVTAPSR